jgi:HD-GYP domain-containing protein (c-di-GMP phosphodiesterase class II)
VSRQDHDPLEPAQDAPPSVTDFVDELVLCTAALRIDGESPARALEVARRLETTLARLFARGAREPLELRLEGALLVHEGRPLLGATLSAARLIAALARQGSHGLAFERGASAAELLDLARDLERRPAGASEPCARARRLAGAARAAGPVAACALESPLCFYQRLVDHLQELTVRVCRGEAFSLEPTRALAEGLVEHVERDPGALLSLSRYERYEAFTFGHAIRVALLALEFARAQSLARPALARLGLAALLHDLGKAHLPFEVLYSPLVLDERQRAEMELHAQHGAATLAAMDADPLCVAVALGHHRRHDGGGYPRTAHAARLGPATRLVQLCDVFEALTAPRPHRAALAPARAYRILLAMTGHFEPRLLRRFVAVHGVWPVGAAVRLSSGERARVVAQSARLDRPRVRLTAAADGAPLALEEQRELDLSDAYEARAIQALLEPPAADALAA